MFTGEVRALRNFFRGCGGCASFTLLLRNCDMLLGTECDGVKMTAGSNKLIVDRKILTKVARKLQAGYSKETTGKVNEWADLSDDERRLWIRLATRAANAILSDLQ